MAIKWMIFRSGETLGPWSSAHVREELRAGRLDAFDLVSLEGDKVRRPLIEVDAIFETSAVQPAAIDRQAPTLSPPPVHSAAKNDDDDMIEPKVVGLSAGSNAASASGDLRPSRPRAFEALASPDLGRQPLRGFDGNSQSKPNQSRRSYIIWVPGARPQGPFTSREVLTLWYARKLTAGTKIQKGRHHRRVDVAVFAQFYERKAGSGVAFLSQAAAASSHRGRLLAWIGIIIAVLIAVTAIYAVLTTSGGEGLSTGPKSVSGPFERNIEESMGSVPTGLSNFAAQPKVQKDSLTVSPAVAGNNKSSGAKTPKMPPKSPGSLKPKAIPRVIPRAAEITKLPNRRGSLSSPVPVQVPSKMPVQVKSPVVSRAPRTAVSNVQTLIEGRTVSLRGYSFNINALKSCDLKCKIPMRGPQGSITAVFFKEAFGQALAVRASGVALTGLVRKDPSTNGLILIVQRID